MVPETCLNHYKTNIRTRCWLRNYATKLTQRSENRWHYSTQNFHSRRARHRRNKSNLNWLNRRVVAMYNHLHRCRHLASPAAPRSESETRARIRVSLATNAWQTADFVEYSYQRYRCKNPPPSTLACPLSLIETFRLSRLVFKLFETNRKASNAVFRWRKFCAQRTLNACNAFLWPCILSIFR